MKSDNICILLLFTVYGTHIKCSIASLLCTISIISKLLAISVWQIFIVLKLFWALCLWLSFSTFFTSHHSVMSSSQARWSCRMYLINIFKEFVSLPSDLEIWLFFLWWWFYTRIYKGISDVMVAPQVHANLFGRDLESLLICLLVSPQVQGSTSHRVVLAGSHTAVRDKQQEEP